MNIYGFNKLTLLDYPKHMAATIFVGNCNFRCPFCHNASLVLSPETQIQYQWSDIKDFLTKRKNTLEGVCFTGGEPTIYSDLIHYIREIKDLGYKIKLDTNGTNFSVLKQLIQENLIDYVALDIKNSKEKYARTTGVNTLSLDSIEKCVDFLIHGTLDYEFRTTVARELQTKEDILHIAQWIKGAKFYFIQAFVDSGDLIAQGLTPYEKAEMEQLVEIATPFVKECSLRGIN